MKFETSSQEMAYNRVAPMVKELFGETGARPQGEHPQWFVASGSALLSVAVLPWRDDASLVSALAWVARGSDLNQQCLEFLLRENHSFVFGAFSVDKEGDIAFSHSILGETCDKDELRHLVLSVAAVADQYDDKIVSRWGGQRGTDG